MKCTAQALLNRYSNFQGLPPGVSGSIRSERTRRIVNGGGFNPVPPVPPFDGTLCAMVIAGGGGDAFDCYTVGSTPPLPNGGTAFSAIWYNSNNYVRYANGDSFDTYTVGAVTTNTLSGGEGFSNNWYLS